jgi:LysR family transcriptional regulator, low CO2-responsive transcriptional regulator
MLSGEEFIVREHGSGTRAAMEQFFRESRIAPAQVMETTSNETIKQAVIANMGLAFLSLHTTGLELQNGLLTALDVVGLPLVRRWHIVHLQGRPLSPAAEALRYFVIEHGEALIRTQFGAEPPGPVATPAVAPVPAPSPWTAARRRRRSPRPRARRRCAHASADRRAAPSLLASVAMLR